MAIHARLGFVFMGTLLLAGCAPEDRSGGTGAADGGGPGAGPRADGGSPGDNGGTSEAGSACEFTVECVPGATCYMGVCVGEGALRFSMSWMDDTDIDLHVITPSGEEIYFANDTSDGGTLDVDDCVSGECTVPDGAHVENVVFSGAAPRGAYEFWAHNYDGEMAAEVTIESFADGVPSSFTEVLPTSGDGEGVHHPLTY